MSADPTLIQQMLSQQLQQPVNGGMQGGQPGRVSPLNAAATLAQKATLVRALQNGAANQQQRQANQMLPGSQALMANDPTMQALQNGSGAANPAIAASPQMQLLQQQMQQPLPIQDPSLMPPEGFS